MANNRRQPPRRQGIRYGPPREKARFSDNGVLIGRLLGLGILLLTVGVLAAGAFAFMRDTPAAATATPRRTFAVSSPPLVPSPTALATVSATATPVASVVPSGSPTPLPTNPPPLVQIGEGYVTFGTKADNSLHIIDPKSVFKPNERIVWSAFLFEPTDSVDLLVRISKMDPTQIGGELVISDSPVTPLVRDGQIFQNRIRPGADLSGPGIYAVRYLRGEEILSEGFLEITE